MKQSLTKSAFALSVCFALGGYHANAQSSSDTNSVEFSTQHGKPVNVGGPRIPGHFRPPLWVNATPSTASYFTPAQVRHAYGVDVLANDGTGQTIAIVDAYGYSGAQTDLNTFCKNYGLPNTTLNIQYPQGKPGLINSSWAQETALDVQWAHAIAPKANILLVVAKSASNSDLLNAVDYAVSKGATVVSMSWGGSEYSSELSNDSHFNKPNVTFVASSGDSGAGVEYPAASPYVLSVGGTSLYLNSDNTRNHETAWSGSGGGTSTYESILNGQRQWSSSPYRMVPDVSYVADPNTGMAVIYNGRLIVVGGTSAGAPQWAALIALANQKRSTPLSAQSGTQSALSEVYSWASSPTIDPTYFNDITQGNTGIAAVPGYDEATGLGTPVSNKLVPALSGAPAPDFSILISPTIQTVPPTGGQITYSVTVNPSTFSGDISLTAAADDPSITATLDQANLTATAGVVQSVTLTVSSALDGSYSTNHVITVTGTGTPNGGGTALTRGGKTQFINYEDIFGLQAAGAQYAQNQAIELGTVFKPAVSGVVTKVRLLRSPSETGLHRVRIWNYDTGELLAPATNPLPSDPSQVPYYAWTPSTSTDWQEFQLPTPIQLQAGVNYVVSISTGTDSGSNYGYIAAYFQNAGSSADISYPSGAGVYTTTLGTMPKTVGGGYSGYMRDIEFLPGVTLAP